MESIAVTASPSGGFEVRISATNLPKRLLAGMKGKASITVEALRSVLLVPAGFVIEEDGKKLCHTKSGPKEVTTGKTDGKKVQILSGLVEGDVVVMPKK